MEAQLAVELDSNGMRKVIVDLFCSKLDALQANSTAMITLQSASLECLRSLAERVSQAAPQVQMTEQERKLLDAIQNAGK